MNENMVIANKQYSYVAICQASDNTGQQECALWAEPERVVVAVSGLKKLS